MRWTEKKYRGIISSDWSECLSPNGPFDPISFTFPELKPMLVKIFRDYTGNVITFREATTQIKEALPTPLGQDQMDAYLNSSFETYTHVPELIEWCLANNILFMLNTTGTQGYFQRAIAKGFLPEIPIISANPMIAFSATSDSTDYSHVVLEIEDKAKSTEAVATLAGLPANKVIVIGDSGGDGPHFRWAASHGAFVIGSMTKQSLIKYCTKYNITINKFFGVKYEPGESRVLEEEMKIDFMGLVDTIRDVLF